MNGATSSTFSSNDEDSNFATSDSSSASDDDDHMDHYCNSRGEGDEFIGPDATSTWRISHGNQRMNFTIEESLRIRRHQGSSSSSSSLKLGTTKVHTTITKDDEDDSVESNANRGSNTKGDDKKRSKGKHAPTEVSSKKRDFYSRQHTSSLGSRGINFEAASIVHHYKPRDPRSMMESSTTASGKRQRYDKEYEFLDDIIKAEIETLKERIAARKITGARGKRARRRLNICNDGNLEEDQRKVKQLKEQLTQRLRAAAERDAKVTLKQKMEQDIAEGKKPVQFLKRKERRKVELETTFEELRKRGGDAAVNKAIAKRRKKNASKDHKYVPLTHPKTALHSK
jgi:ribosomal RNA-processing protein 36